MTAIKVKLLSEHAKLPTRATAGSNGWDLYASEDVVLRPGEWYAVKTDVAIEIPRGNIAALVVPRSGLAKNHGLTILNGPGLIDSDFRGEIHSLLINHERAFSKKISRGDRIGQLVFVELPAVTLEVAAELSQTERGSGGFGSTGN